MRRRADRIVLNLTVELTARGHTVHAVSQDVTPFGMFLRMAAPLPVGTEVELAFSPAGVRLTTTATVVHALRDHEARQLGRQPGVGVALGEPRDDDARAFAAELARLVAQRAPLEADGEALRVVVADGETRMLERLSTALGAAGFRVATAANGLEALGAALGRDPDLILADRDLPVMDGLALLTELGRYPELAGVPVMVMTDRATDLVRLEALQRGAVDVLPKPFTTLEVVLRARRLARVARRDGERVLLRGAVEQLGLPSLLTMLAHDRKTGVLRLTRDQTVVWLSFVDGRLVHARASAGRDDSRATVMRVLDWTAGHFELSAGAAEGAHELDDSVTHLLLEHARQRDERRGRA